MHALLSLIFSILSLPFNFLPADFPDVDRHPGEETPISPMASGGNHLVQQQPQQRVQARYDYEPKEDDELELRVGDVILVLERNLPDDGWWQGYNTRTQRFGLFPDNFVVPFTGPGVPAAKKENETAASTLVNQEPGHIGSELMKALMELGHAPICLNAGMYSSGWFSGGSGVNLGEECIRNRSKID
ncbi:unnamed protein product [Protopolystoma xenopodis]|uniref:SH3 domain-containing protein n=1 Tax=Protopolystoma xenopodis TaxID=117903 RepID=A0A3S5BQH5_9PLAT|nr:unnamed protein product [Protopolystoma xenopodis]